MTTGDPLILAASIALAVLALGTRPNRYAVAAREEASVVVLRDPNKHRRDGVGGNHEDGRKEQRRRRRQTSDGDGDPAPPPDDGDGETPLSPLAGMGWHVDMIGRDGCTDDDDYDDDWAKPGIRDLWFFATPEECCAAFFDGPDGCRVRKGDARPPSGGGAGGAPKVGDGCDAGPWHPDFGSEARAGCSNDDDVPKDWHELFGSAQECCEKYSDRDGACAVRDVCAAREGVTYLRGIFAQPTRPPTLPPSFSPTTVDEWQDKYYTPMSDSPGGDIDFFLLSGQSNMHGHSTSAFSITEDDGYWMRIKSILETEGAEPGAMGDALRDVIRAANSGQADPEVVASTLTDGTMELFDAGLLRDLDTPLRLGSCSFIEPLGRHEVNDRSGGTRPLVWDAGCGGIFGPELMLGRTLEMEMGQRNRFEAVKNARGGTKIHEHWYPDHGKFWVSLRSSIRSRKGYGNWKAFVWYQGINDALEDHKYEDTSLTYLGNLTGLIRGVRAEMFDASEPGAWRCPEEIPAVVVQIGRFPQTDRARRVGEAQALHCDGDPRAALVATDDLSRNYHLDAPSLLIEGHRIARAYGEAIRGDATCPSDPGSPVASSLAPATAGRPMRSPSSTATDSPLMMPAALILAVLFGLFALDEGLFALLLGAGVELA